MPRKSTSSGAQADSEAFGEVVRRVKAAKSLLVLTHDRPDGDGLGSMVALAACARAAGKDVRLLVPDGVPERYAFLFAGQTPAGADRFAELAGGADLIVVLDTCTEAQLNRLAGPLRDLSDRTAVIDHHVTVEPIGAARWIDASAAATGVMVAELLAALRWPAAPPAAEALMTAVATDTGWLRFSNTDGRALRAVAEWVDSGVRPDVLYKRIYQTDRPERLGLMARAIESLEFHGGGRLAVMTLRLADFGQTGAREDETENLINEAMRIGAVEVAILLSENADGVRVSFRSRSAVDVAAVAKRFGGGGHARAAGLRADEDLDDLKSRLVDACAKALADAERSGAAG